MSDEAGRPAFCERHYVALSLAVLALAACNLTFRLGSEVVTEWDESLYAITAWEMRTTGHWIGTTFLGTLDYYNTKPPLNVWLIALAFKSFGASLLSLRLASAAAAWSSIAIVQAWSRRTLGAEVALLSGIVLSTSFGFLYVHSGRSANTDALFTLLIVLTAVTLWVGDKHPAAAVWLGPIAASAFLLRGMAVLMVIAIALVVETWRARRGRRIRTRPLMLALLLFAVPAGGWILMRWQLDGWLFLGRLFGYDFIARSLTVIEDHPGTPLYYLNILQKQQFDWVLAGIAALALCPLPWSRIRTLFTFWRGDDVGRMVLGTWTAVALVVPTLMRTKLPWYLNTFYPAFAIGIAWILAHALFGAGSDGAARRRQAIAGAVFAIALVGAESRLIWYSFHYRDLAHSGQGVLFAERDTLRGVQVFGKDWNYGDIFVLEALLQGTHREAPSLEDFFFNSKSGDYLLSSQGVDRPELLLVRSNSSHWLYRRVDPAQRLTRSADILGKKRDGGPADVGEIP